MGNLTDEQIENWRLAMFRQFGPYAWIMPVEDIQAAHDRFQVRLDAVLEKGE